MRWVQYRESRKLTIPRADTRLTLAKSFGLDGEGPIVDPDDIHGALERGVKLAKAKAGKLALVDTVTQPR